jgi:hypothetical protein
LLKACLFGWAPTFLGFLLRILSGISSLGIQINVLEISDGACYMPVLLLLFTWSILPADVLTCIHSVVSLLLQPSCCWLHWKLGWGAMPISYDFFLDKQVDCVLLSTACPLFLGDTGQLWMVISLDDSDRKSILNPFWHGVLADHFRARYIQRVMDSSPSLMKATCLSVEWSGKCLQNHDWVAGFPLSLPATVLIILLINHLELLSKKSQWI